MDRESVPFVFVAPEARRTFVYHQELMADLPFGTPPNAVPLPGFEPLGQNPRHTDTETGRLQDMRVVPMLISHECGQ